MKHWRQVKRERLRQEMQSIGDDLADRYPDVAERAYSVWMAIEAGHKVGEVRNRLAGLRGAAADSPDVAERVAVLSGNASRLMGVEL